MTALILNLTNHVLLKILNIWSIIYSSKGKKNKNQSKKACGAFVIVLGYRNVQGCWIPWKQGCWERLCFSVLNLLVNLLNCVLSLKKLQVQGHVEFLEMHWSIKSGGDNLCTLSFLSQIWLCLTSLSIELHLSWILTVLTKYNFDIIFRIIT